MAKTKTPLRVAILVQKFPDIVQSYILNHIINLKNAGADITTIDVSNPKQSVNEYDLIFAMVTRWLSMKGITFYISTPC